MRPFLESYFIRPHSILWLLSKAEGKDQFLNLTSVRPHEVSSRILGLLSMYCTVHMLLFFIFWICSNIFGDFSVCRHTIFKCFDTIRFVFPLAFQCRIPNFSTTKTCKWYSEKKTESQKRCIGFSLFFVFFQTNFTISRAVGVHFLIVFILSFH